MPRPNPFPTRRTVLARYIAAGKTAAEREARRAKVRNLPRRRFDDRAAREALEMLTEYDLDERDEEIRGAFLAIPPAHPGRALPSIETVAASLNLPSKLVAVRLRVLHTLGVYERDGISSFRALARRAQRRGERIATYPNLGPGASPGWARFWRMVEERTPEGGDGFEQGWALYESALSYCEDCAAPLFERGARRCPPPDNGACRAKASRRKSRQASGRAVASQKAEKG